MYAIVFNLSDLTLNTMCIAKSCPMEATNGISPLDQEDHIVPYLDLTMDCHHHAYISMLHDGMPVPTLYHVNVLLEYLHEENWLVLEEWAHICNHRKLRIGHAMWCFAYYEMSGYDFIRVLYKIIYASLTQPYCDHL